MRRSLLAAAVVTTATAWPAAALAAPLADRAADPIVIVGADVPALEGSDPGRIVAFAYDDRWKQIPVQVDERKIVDYGDVRQNGGAFSAEAYADAGTFAGPDPDATVDSDDEIALMARDAGDRAVNLPSPNGVVGSSRTSLAVSDPLADDPARYVYLFETDEGLDPAAGESYVDYDFDLDSGDYKTTYDWNGVADNGAGPPANTEDSSVTTPFYRKHILARWVEDELAIGAGSSTDVDVLDGDKVQVNFGCGRSELTFSRGGGGFIANRSGPIRAIRSYIGANSGTYTQQDRIYYERSEVMRTYLRVHPGISTIDQFLDYSPAASGMTYRTSADPAGVTINGTPDPDLETGNALGPAIDWEQATGPQGSLSIVSRVETDIPGFAAGSYYQDDLTPTTPQCGGYADTQAWGSSGPGITGVGVNTDPTLGAAKFLTGTRTTFFSGPGANASLAALRSDQVDEPLEVEATAQPESGRPKLKLSALAPKRDLEPGGNVRIPIIVANRGSAPATGVEVCGRTAKRLATVGCKEAERLRPGRTFETKLRVKATDRPRRFLQIVFKVTADDARSDRDRKRVPIAR